MSLPGQSSRIPINVNRGLTGLLFGLALVTYGVRTYIRARILKQFFTEDALLLFAVICLCGTTGLAYAGLQSLYDELQVILHAGKGGLLVKVLDRIPEVAKEENASATLVWLVIFSVKMAYLFFFRRLVSRVKHLMRWWWFVVSFTVTAGFVCIAVAWLTCPYSSIEKVLTCTGKSANYRTIRDTSVTTAMDVTSDILVVSLPVALLWKVRINVWQKVGLSLSLCLSLVMVFVTIVRMAGIKLAGVVDIVWLAFWQQQECSIAVIMVSVSAFRSFFVAGAARKRSPKLPIASRRVILANNQSPTADTSVSQGLTASNAGRMLTSLSPPIQLPQIPSATLTSVRGFIRNAQSSSSRMTDSSSDTLMLSSNDGHDNFDSSSDGDPLGTRRDGLEKLAESQRPPFKHLPSSQNRSSRPDETASPDEDAERAQSSGRKQSRWNRIARWRRPGSDGTQTGYWSILSMFRTGDASSMEQYEVYSETTKPKPPIPIPGGNP